MQKIINKLFYVIKRKFELVRFLFDMKINFNGNVGNVLFHRLRIVGIIYCVTKYLTVSFMMRLCTWMYNIKF